MMRQDLVESTSTSLVDGLKRLEPLAWRRLCQLYGPLVYSWCRRFDVPQADAADVAQEVFRAIHAHIAEFRRDQPQHSFRGWLWTIARNKIRDHFRSSARRAQAAGGTDAHIKLLGIPEDPTSPGDTSSGPWQLQTSLLRGLEVVQAEFEERTWQAFWRTVVDGISTAQAADELNMSVNAVRLAKSRVLRRLREVLAEDTEA